MLKKRIIFTLLYNNGNFVLSRNFRLQRVGDLRWLQTNYNFSSISFSIDELVVLDVSRDERNTIGFCESLKSLTENCFVPISAGGGIRNIEQARRLLRSGADKIVVNTPLFEDPELIGELASEFGQQCIIASMDLKHEDGGAYGVWVESGSKRLEDSAPDCIAMVCRQPVGELYLNSIDKDGTGQGYDFKLLTLLPPEMGIPVIMAGGVGNAKHLAEGINVPRIDAVATAHLFNFVGDGLMRARRSLIEDGADLAIWDPALLERKNG